MATEQKLTKTTFGGEFAHDGYQVQDRATGIVLGIVYKRTHTSNEMSGRILVGTTSSARWHYQLGNENADWKPYARNDLGFFYARADAVTALARRVKI